MLHPEDVKRKNEVLDHSLGQERQLWGDDGLQSARRQARAFLRDAAYADLRLVMREVGTAHAQPEPMLDAQGFTAAENVLFRVGAAAFWRMIVRLAEEADQ